MPAYAHRVRSPRRISCPRTSSEYSGTRRGPRAVFTSRECRGMFHGRFAREYALRSSRSSNRPPRLPAGTPWGLFPAQPRRGLTLRDGHWRNEERDYMYEGYAKIPRIEDQPRIRRTLAPPCSTNGAKRGSEFDARDAVLACQFRRSSTYRERRSGWRQHSPRARPGRPRSQRRSQWTANRNGG